MSFKNTRLARFLARGDPAAFCIKAVFWLAVLPLVTLTPPFKTLVEEPLILVNAWLTHVSLAAIGAESVLDGPFVRTSSSPPFGMEIVSACTGLFTMVILLAVILAFPARWPWRIAGIAAGWGMIFVVNLIRLVTLFLIGREYPQLFDEVHLIVWQTVTIALALAFWYVWARRALRGMEPAGDQAESRP